MKNKHFTTDKGIIKHFVYILFFVALVYGFTNCSTNNKGGSFYYSEGEKIEFKSPHDSIAILLQHYMNPDSLKKRLQILGYTYVRSLSENVVIVIPSGKNKTDKDELIKLSIDLSAKDSQLIQKAGYVAYQKNGKYPFIITNDLMAGFKKGVPEDKINKLLSKYHIHVVTQNPFRKTQYVLRATEYLHHDAVKASRLLAEDSIVEYAHPNFIMVKKYQSIDPTDPAGITFYKFQWHHNNSGQGSGTVDADIDTDLAWEYTRGDSSTIIAIMDKEFDTTHPDLEPNFSYNPFEMRDGYNGRDDDDDDNDPTSFIDDILGWNFHDCSGENGHWGSHVLNTNAGGEPGHGTAVMGMAVAVNNRFGVIGSCPECSVIPLQGGGGSLANEDAFEFDYARARGAKIISCSWIYTSDLIPPGITDNINDAFNAGITIFFSINNDDGNHCEIIPKIKSDISALNSVIAVASSTNLDLFSRPGPNGTTIHNSGYGDSMDILAPGACGYLADFSTMKITTTDLQIRGQNPGEFCSTYTGIPINDPNVKDNYAFCWYGTSFATPLTAGVAGLLHSADPSLTPKQVQYLLQDCADKIQHSYGNYSSKNGFSNSDGGGVPTHGYGRVNAFEAVRIAAPVSNGTNKPGMGGMDIFLRDNELDWGNTEQPSNTKFESPRTDIGWWRSQDIKVDAPPFLNATVISNNKGFDDFTDEDPKGGVRNRVYVRVRNRGYKTVHSVLVKLHWADACLAFPALPPDFWDRFPNDASNVSLWHPLPAKTISDLKYSGCSVAGKSDDDGSQIVVFDFDAPVYDITRTSYHYCLMALVSSPDDPMPTNELRTDPQRWNMDFVTTHYNNATHRNYTFPNSAQPFSAQFYLYNPYTYTITTKIETDSGKQISFVFEDSLVTKEFQLKKGERKLVRIRINPGELSKPEEITIRQLLIGKKKGEKKVMGGFTYFLKPSKKPKK